MSSLTQAIPGARLPEILARVKISEVYCVLTGKQPRRVGSDAWRATAVWRGGDGPNVSLNDTRNVWHDFATNEGGGVLDLVVRICGGSRQDALRWLADFAGVPLENGRLSPKERADWAEQQRRINRELPKARLWQRTAVALGDQVLDTLKAALADSKLPRPEIGEIAFWTSQITSWRRMAGAELVDEYLWWAGHQPRLTAGMIYAANLREMAEHQALRRYLRTVEPGARI
jgi:hypothetical protein